MFGVTVARLAARIGIRIPGVTAAAKPADVRVGIIEDIVLAAVFAVVGAALYLLLPLDRPGSADSLRRGSRRDDHGQPAVPASRRRDGSVLQHGLCSELWRLRPAPAEHACLRLHAHRDGPLPVVGVLGHLAYQSAQLPTVISAVLIVNLITATLIKFLWPDVPTALHEACTPPAVVDLWLIAYLVIRGAIRVSPNIAAPKPDPASPRRGQPRSPSPSPDAASTE